MNENEHIYDDCIGNPPFSEALKTLGGGGGYEYRMETDRGAAAVL